MLESDLKKKDIQFVIDNFLKKIKESVSNSDSVEIRGFGTFYRVERKSRKVHSPIAGKVIEVPAKTALAFKASKTTERKL